MKLAVMQGGSCYKIKEYKSWYIKDNEMYNFDDNELYTGPLRGNPFSNYCSFFGESCFLNLQEWEEELPDLDLDIIIYANERRGLETEYWDVYSVERLKNKYPRAKVMGYLKELTIPEHKYKNWIRFLNDCDFVIGPAIDSLQKSKWERAQLQLNKKINFFATPHDIDDIYDKFYSNVKDNVIFVYTPNSIYRQARTNEFAEYIGKKYNIPLVRKPLTQSSTYSPVDQIHMSWDDFTNIWSPCLYNFNLDPMEEQPGQHAVAVAAVGSINVGGVNESHRLLFPETATCDESILEARFVEYINNSTKRFEVIEYAWKKVNELYSLNTIKKQLLEMLGKG